MKKTLLCLILGALLGMTQAEAKLKLPSIIGDHMVLQKGTPSVWGWADPGETVTVALGNNAKTAQADDQGRWKVSLALPRAGGPYEMTVSSAGESVTIEDVLVGEVWLGSGQSNMEFAMKTSSDADTEIPAANFPTIRLFTAARVAAFTPLADVQGFWKVCSPDTVGDFSAVAYHFGKELHKAFKKVPVGLIVAAWGGSGAEAWTPRETLEKDPVFTQLIDQWDHNEKQIKTWKEGDDFELWVSDIRFMPKDPKDKPLTVSAQTDPQSVGGPWQISVKPECQGAVTVTDKAFSGQGPAVRFFGAMKGGGWGTLSSNLSAQNRPLDLRKYQSVEFYIKGKGQYRVSLGQPSILDYDFYASKDPFDAPVSWTKMHFDIADLKQGGWGGPKPFTADTVISLNFPIQVPYWPDVVAACYDGMAAPLTPYTIRGVLWYQGESNTGRASQYHQLLSDLITSWRRAWGEDFPFLIIQLPNFMAAQDNPSESQWAELREAQLQTSQTVPKTGLITTIDLGEANNIHPKDKTDVGHRAALAALGVAYHRSTVYSGPSLLSTKLKGAQVVLKFGNTGKGLMAKGGGSLKGFAIAGADQKFYWATAEIKGETVVVFNEQVPDPEVVRYGWADNPVCNLYNFEGLPASPFQYSFPPKPGAKAATDGIPPPP